MRMDTIALERLSSYTESTRPAAGRMLPLGPALNVIDPHREGLGTTLADLAGHVMYGSRHVAVGRGDAEGYVDVTSPRGRYRLRRHESPTGEGDRSVHRLTVSPLDGSHADSHTARELLAGLSPTTASRLMAVDLTAAGHFDWLLSEELAEELHRLERAHDPTAGDPRWPADAANRELFALRDRLTHEIETLLGEKRRTSQQLEALLREIEQEQAELRESIAQTRREHDRVVAELAELETEHRYRELVEVVERTADQAHRAQRQPELALLDTEIDRWREMLGELEHRETEVRQELARLHPDEASPLLPLADQRAAVAIAERLVNDLDSEVARFARPGDSHACACRHAHARLHPLVDTLGEQVDTLARLIGQYEAALHGQQLRSEAQHLARTQGELRQTLEHLLDRRQEALRTSRSRKASDADSETVKLPTAGGTARREQLERQRGELLSRLHAEEQRLGSLDARHQQLSSDRARLMTDATLSRLRAELDEVTRKLDSREVQHASTGYRANDWRASDILAKLTDGRLREVRLVEGGRDVHVVDAHGNLRDIDSSDRNDRRLVTASLHLAAVAAVARWGSRLPLVLADPFAGLSSAETSILALVLHDFARAGHQVVVFTTSPMALDRWRAAGQQVLDWHLHSKPLHATEVEVEYPKPREVAVSVSAPVAVAPHDPFTLRTDDPVGRFPVLGGAASTTFERLGIETIGDLIEIDPAMVSRELDLTGVSQQVVELWQAHLALLCFLPGLDLDDAQLLTGAGIWRPEELLETTSKALTEAMQNYLETPAGNRLRRLSGGSLSDRAEEWIASAKEHRLRWEASNTWKRFRRRELSVVRPTRQASVPSTSNGSGRLAQKSKSKNGAAKSKARPTRPLQFRLSRASGVVDAPSIGPKLARKLERIGLGTVANLLEADAEATAEALDQSSIDAETVVGWQHQAQLMCRVPELSARDTQVLVGCGFAAAEDIAESTASDLLEFVKSFCVTSEGQRVLRGGEAPDLARVSSWIRWAKQRRALEAA